MEDNQALPDISVAVVRSWHKHGLGLLHDVAIVANVNIGRAHSAGPTYLIDQPGKFGQARVGLSCIGHLSKSWLGLLAMDIVMNASPVIENRCAPLLNLVAAYRSAVVFFLASRDYGIQKQGVAKCHALNSLLRS